METVKLCPILESHEKALYHVRNDWGWNLGSIMVNKVESSIKIRKFKGAEIDWQQLFSLAEKIEIQE